MSWSVLPTKRSPRVDEDVMTDVFTALRRLLAVWRYDPDKLAVACAAWTLAGLSEQALVWDVASGSAHEYGVKSITDVEASFIIERALYSRRRDVLRHRAEGLLMVLEAVAHDVEQARVHRIQVDACVIECRQLSPDERFARLREVAGTSA